MGNDWSYGGWCWLVGISWVLYVIVVFYCYWDFWLLVGRKSEVVDRMWRYLLCYFSCFLGFYVEGNWCVGY